MAGFRKKKYFYPYLDNSLGKKKTKQNNEYSLGFYNGRSVRP